MLPRSIFARALVDYRRGLLGWALGFAALTGLYVAFYPSYQSPEMTRTLESLPPELLDVLGLSTLTSPEGYLRSTVLSLLGPLLMIVFVAAWCARTIAGEEEEGRLELLLAHPVSRTRFLLQRFAAVVTGVVLMGLVVVALLLAVAPLAGLDTIPAGNLLAAVLELVLAGVCFAALAVATAGATGRRPAVLGVTAGVGLLSYAANSIAAGVDALAWSRRLSPLYYATANDPLVNGVSLANSGVLLGISAVLLGIALWTFNRRDLAT